MFKSQVDMKGADRWCSGTMRGTRKLLLAITVVVAAQLATAQKLTGLHLFNGTDGSNPNSPLILDDQGHLYGMTSSGGYSSVGVVYMISTNGTTLPGAQESILYSFSGAEGDQPYAGLVRDRNGNLYGTTEYGGVYAWGNVFQLTPGGEVTVLHSFTSEADGGQPLSTLTLDDEGNLYGTTEYGGSSGWGTVFRMTPNGTETVLHSFGGGTDGGRVVAGVIRDKQGNLYGATVLGGLYNFGTIFEVTPAGTETVLHSFNNGDGSWPFDVLVRDKSGNLYGTTELGGSYGLGTVFKLSPSRNLTVLHSFAGEVVDGAYPGGIVRDRQGSLYGTTAMGGTFDAGTVFRITKKGIEQVIYDFTGGVDGSVPYGVILDSDGNLYGITGGGGIGYGTVFKLTP